VDTTEIINRMIDDIIDGNNTDAKAGFDSALSSKLTDALDVRKVELAQSIYSKEEDNEPVPSEE
jgi:hypothetical protein